MGDGGIYSAAALFVSGGIVPVGSRVPAYHLVRIGRRLLPSKGGPHGRRHFDATSLRDRIEEGLEEYPVRVQPISEHVEPGSPELRRPRLGASCGTVPPGVNATCRRPDAWEAAATRPLTRVPTPSAGNSQRWAARRDALAGTHEFYDCGQLRAADAAIGSWGSSAS